MKNNNSNPFYKAEAKRIKNLAIGSLVYFGGFTCISLYSLEDIPSKVLFTSWFAVNTVCCACISTAANKELKKKN